MRQVLPLLCHMVRRVCVSRISCKLPEIYRHLRRPHQCFDSRGSALPLSAASPGNCGLLGLARRCLKDAEEGVRSCRFLRSLSLRRYTEECFRMFLDFVPTCCKCPKQPAYSGVVIILRRLQRRPVCFPTRFSNLPPRTDHCSLSPSRSKC